jgi:ATP-dependent Zn protease
MSLNGIFVQVSMIIEAEYARAVRLLEENKDKLEMFASMLMVKKVGCCCICKMQVP